MTWLAWMTCWKNGRGTVESEHEVEFYCPCCGEVSKVKFYQLSPGDIVVECPSCKTNWVISIEYQEM